MTKNNLVQTWYSIERIELFKNLTQDGLECTEESFASFLLCKDKPYVPDNETVDRDIRIMINNG